MEKVVAQVKAGWEFFQRHRSKWGATLIAVGTYLATLGPEYAHHSQLALLVGGIFAGGGAMKSDAQVQAQQKWEREGVDRRQVQ